MPRRGALRFRVPALVPALVLFAILFLALATVVIALHVRVLGLQQEVAELSGEENGEDARGLGDARSDGGSEQSGREIFEAAVEGVGDILAERNASRAQRLLAELTERRGEFSLTQESGLWHRADGEHEASLLRDEQRYFSVVARPDLGTVEIESILEETYTVENLGDDGAEALEFVQGQIDRIDRVLATQRRLRDELRGLPDRPAVSRLLETRNMQPTRIVEEDFVLRRGFANEGGAIVVRIAADAENGEYRVDDRTMDVGDAELESAVADAIRSYDPQEEVARTRDELESRLSRVVEDKGFRAFLEERNLDVSKDYELVLREDGDEAVVAHFVIDAGAGTIELVEARGDDSWTLDRVAVTHGMHRRGEEPEHPGFLLLGRHQGLADTIMYIRPREDAVSVISIPRDIYHEGRKLNEVHASAGPAATVLAVEELIGVEIDHYVSADFEAFRRIVDALGSVPVELDREFLDPTMQYSVDGEKSMLYFSPGRHELNGSAALAFARSRKTSSDFSRSRRQQMLIAGIRTRVDQLALTDADHLFDLLRVAVEYTETDMGFLEALDYYRRYRDVEDLRRIVLSTDNVFRSTYADLYENGMPLERAEELDEEELGQWILRPKNGSWDGVRRFVDEWLAGGSPRSEEFFDEEQTLDQVIDAESAIEIDLSLLEEITSRPQR